MTEPVPTPRYARIVAAANKVAQEWGHNYVGVEHLFLAIIRDRDAVPTQVLARLVDLNEVQTELSGLMESVEYRTPTTKQRPPEEE